MKATAVYKKLPIYVLCAGGIGLLLRLWLLSGTDEKGLLTASPLGQVLLALLALTVPALLFYLTRSLSEARKYSFNFPASLPAAIGTGLAALSIGIRSIIDLSISADAIDVLCGLLGIISATGLSFAAWCRYLGKRPNFLFHITVSIYLMFLLICQYRKWSSDPQLLDYCFQILATICLMLTAYYRAAFDNGSGDRGSYAFFALCTLFFCCLSLVNWGDILFYLGIAAWMFTDLCNLTPLLSRGMFHREDHK